MAKTQSNRILEIERLRAKGLEEISRLQSLGFDVGEQTIQKIEQFPKKEKYTVADVAKMRLLTNANRIRSYATKETDELQFINYRYKASIPLSGEKPIKFRLSYAEVQRGEEVETLIKAAEKLNKDRKYADKAHVDLYYAQKEMEALKYNLEQMGLGDIIKTKKPKYKSPRYSEMSFDIRKLRKALRTGDPMDENSAFRLLEKSIRRVYETGATSREGIEAIRSWQGGQSYKGRLQNLFEDEYNAADLEDEIAKIFEFIDASAQSGYIKRNDLDSKQIRTFLDRVVPIATKYSGDIGPRVTKMILNDTDPEKLFKEFERMMEGDFSNPEDLW